MKSEECKTFLKWYENLKEAKYFFDFQDEILHYCRLDVTILRLACLKFRSIFLISVEFVLLQRLLPLQVRSTVYIEKTVRK